jgi:hypothetical protein
VRSLKIESMMKLKQKNSLLDKLKESGEMTARFPVYSESFGLHMQLVGFVPYWSLNVDMNSEVIFTPYRVRNLKQEVTLPVMGAIRTAVSNERFLMSRTLYTPYGFDIRGFNYYLLALDQAERTQNTAEKRIDWSKSSDANTVLRYAARSEFYKQRENLQVNDERGLEYIASDDEFVMTRTYGNYTAIAGRFLCSCAYMNTVTGRPSYLLFDPEDLFIEGTK